MANGKFRGYWHLGWSYKEKDITIDNGAYYKAKSDRPCYDEPPHLNSEWEWCREYQSKNNKKDER